MAQDHSANDQKPTDRPTDEREVEELRESAKSMGVEDADQKDPDEVVEAVQHTQTDSETSPSGWKAEEEGGDRDR
ncbi:hypothetical protein [Euzebya sp.]|uniref:hypothetical protein n=1 Tax=Euzebya sp. TaxID=1971409 RepID=UPI003516726F